MLTQKLALRSNSLATSWFRVPLKFSGVRSLHRCTLPCKIACRPGFKAQDAAAAFAFDWSKIRHYSDAAQARIQEEGLPLQNSGSATASLLAYAATNWPVPSVIPPGWSASWKHWDYLLTLFALSPYFLRLPQIEMLVNVKYAIPGQVRPIIYSDARECVLFWTEIPQDPDEPPDAVPDGAGHVFLLNCRTFELYTYDATHAKHAPDTVEEIVLLVAAAPTPEGVPMVKLEPDAEGEAALARILERDASVIPLLESDFLGYAPRATEPDEELMSADEAAARQKEKFTQAIRNIEAYVAQTEEELAADAAELADLRAVGSPELLEQEGLEKDEEAHAKMRVHLEDAKEKLKALRKAWTESYGPWVK